MAERRDTRPLARRAQAKVMAARLAAAIDHGFRVVRWHLDETSTPLGARR